MHVMCIAHDYNQLSIILQPPGHSVVSSVPSHWINVPGSIQKARWPKPKKARGQEAGNWQQETRRVQEKCRQGYIES